MYTQKDYDKLLTQFEELADKKFSEFHSNLVPGTDNVLGISIPKLRAVAKELLKNCDDIDGYFALVGNKYYEETMLCGIVIGNLKCDWEEKLKYISKFIPKISNWAVCDVFCSGIKPPKNEIDSFREFIEPYLYSQNEFEIRFAVVILLQKYITDNYISSTLQALKSVTDSRYYVKMAVAWALSICYIKFPDLTLNVFKEKSLDKWVQNKAIQKCRESLRVTSEDKEMLLQYKI